MQTMHTMHILQTMLLNGPELHLWAERGQ